MGVLAVELRPALLEEEEETLAVVYLEEQETIIAFHRIDTVVAAVAAVEPGQAEVIHPVAWVGLGLHHR
jgi:DNA repair protein RadC